MGNGFRVRAWFGFSHCSVFFFGWGVEEETYQNVEGPYVVQCIQHNTATGAGRYCKHITVSDHHSSLSTTQ